MTQTESDGTEKCHISTIISHYIAGGHFKFYLWLKILVVLGGTGS